MKSQAFGKKRRDIKKIAGGGFGRNIAATEVNTVPSSSNVSSPTRELEIASPTSHQNNGANSPSSFGEEESLNDKLLRLTASGLSAAFSPEVLLSLSHNEVLSQLSELIDDTARQEGIIVLEQEKQEISTFLLNEIEKKIGPIGEGSDKSNKKEDPKKTLNKAKNQIQPLLMEHIDPAAAADLPRPELAEQVGDVVGELLVQEKINLNLREQRDLVTLLLDDMLGLGPLEPLLADESISDIMVNGPKQVYVEQNGKLTLTDVGFRDNQHLMNVAQRIVTAVGRRVDETSPICDARLADGSRVNVIAPPLAIDGASISIRKFTKDKITLDKMLDFGSITPPLAKLLKIAGACRLNILISGGTGSGKTTMLNALSRMIDKGERVVTIEDAAELQLQQPHVVRLETRPPNLEGQGEITMRDLVKNALRMRPDRIILGEIRGGEAIDMLQAMNTGHDGSMGTIHANRPREGLTRLENMVNMAGLHLPAKAIREQIAGSLDMIVQVQRMRDGGRRTTHVTEVVGMEGDVITTQDLFTYEFTGEDESGKLVGEFKSTGVRPHFLTQAEYFGLDRALMDAMNG
ncbi:CpaF family protein [Kordiimonas sp. SCSIO 12610]|uniref:CpaF family protein n=1 Tax=Kordiimonas sp. SCSIO 12610 TaxID=2829597 RepID=UPI00210DFBEF|nr:CpaF family protein [Kordiimonas sp. SCSIO 12610]UTW56004.1 CpaF family protein [Kordiimonas sp. SCSIO 12610]